MTALRVVFRPCAENDLEAVADFIAKDSPRRAVSFIAEMRAYTMRFGEKPRAYGRRDDLRPGVRQAVYGRCLIFFSLEETRVVVERIVHGARRLDDLV